METGQEYIGSPEMTQYGHWIRVKDKAEYTTDELW